jgi:hypothetical protein
LSHGASAAPASYLLFGRRDGMRCGTARTKELQKFFHSSGGLPTHVQNRHPGPNRLNTTIRSNGKSS